MNLHGIVAGQIGAINPFLPATLRISTGQQATAANGQRVPLYATPGAIVASIASTTLTVTSVGSGVLMPGQSVIDGGVLADGKTTITEQLTGAAGGIGTYALNQAQTVASEAMTTAMIMRAQVQPMGWRDLQAVSGLNLQGTRRKIYLYGRIDGVVRSLHKGGDLITIATGGVNDGVYLVAQVLEQFPDWASVAATLQDGV